MNLIVLSRVCRATVLGGLALAALALPSQASAADLRFMLNTGPDALVFTLPQEPIQPAGTTDYFAFFGVNATLNGAPVFLDTIQFWEGGWARGGFDARIGDSRYFAANGPQLYSGSTSDPRFLTGDFVTTAGAVRIWDPASAVPEPGAWAMMIVGFGVVGGLARRRRALAPATA